MQCPSCGAQAFATDTQCLDCGFNFVTGLPADSLSGQAAVRWHLDNARSDLDRGDHSGALRHLDRVIAADAGNLDGMTLRAHSLELLGMYQDALLQWQQVHGLSPNQEVRQRLLTCAMALATLHERQDHWDEAIGVYDYVLSVSPGDPVALRSREAAQQGRYEYQRAVEQRIDDQMHARASAAEGAAAGGTAGALAGTGIGVMGFIGGMFTMLGGIFLLLLGVCMVPCIIGIFIIPPALGVIATGLAMMGMAPAVAVGTAAVGAAGGAATGRAGVGVALRAAVDGLIEA